MRIGLINAYSTLNLGDAAIYSALATMLPSCEVVARVQDASPDQGLGVRFGTEPPGACRAYVSVGGDIFNNAREWAITKAFLLNLAQLRRHASRTILFGQSIPRSCHGLSFLALRQCLLSLPAVCVRDAQSHGRLRQAGVDARLSFDTAFALECSESARQEAAALYRSLQLRPEAVAVLSVRAFDAMYRHDTGAFIERLAALCSRLVEAGITPAVLIQSRAYGADNDQAVAEALLQRVPATAILDPFRAGSALPCWSLAMGVLALAGHVIAVRYHTAVLALAAGVVPHHLHYSNKGRDLCERLDLPGEDLGSFDPAATAAAILARSHGGFDHASLRRRVRADFSHCLQRLGVHPGEGG